MGKFDGNDIKRSKTNFKIMYKNSEQQKSTKKSKNEEKSIFHGEIQDNDF